MSRVQYSLLIILFIRIIFISQTICLSDHNNWGLPYIFQSDELPDLMNFMPTIGNGHISFTILGDAIYSNGIYNGKHGISHRARIPNYSNIKIDNYEFGVKEKWRTTYTLNARNGIFQIRKENKFLRIVQLIYTHRYYNRIIVNEIYISRLNAQGKIVLDIEQQPGDQNSADFDFMPTTFKTNEELFTTHLTPKKTLNESDIFTVLEGRTTILEDKKYWKEKSNICCIWNKIPSKLELNASEYFKSIKFFMSIDEKCSVAKNELAGIIQETQSLVKIHQDEWEKIWDIFNIEVKGNLELAQAIYASLFALASSLPSLRTYQSNNPYFGLSPGGLGRGGDNLQDYRGHNFWDTEIWMLPVVTQMNPIWTRQLLGYRYRMLDVAMDYAKGTGYKGARFPWESAFTGREVTDPCCLIVGYQQHHITADISFALQHYFSITNDLHWLFNEGCSLSENIAKFWESRVSKNESTGYYDIKFVMGPDEDQPNVTNNAYTNVVAGHALKFAVFANSICDNMDEKETIAWDSIAENLKIVYDQERNYHPQYEGYLFGDKIKQADAILLGYPLLYSMDDSTRRNDLHYYGNVTRSSGPAMTWAMHAINHLDIYEDERAQQLLNKSYKNNIVEPFKVWSETLTFDGAANFLTGAGGFLQAIINGFGGLKVYLDRLEIRKPVITPDTEKITITGIKYLGSTFKLTISKENSFLMCTSLNQEYPLVLYDQNYKKRDITDGSIFKLSTNKTVIRSKKVNYVDWRS